MGPQHHPRKFSRPERRKHARARLHAMPQRFRQQIREYLIERDGQADVAINRIELHAPTLTMEHREYRKVFRAVLIRRA
jgi:hypothetical protein